MTDCQTSGEPSDSDQGSVRPAAAWTGNGVSIARRGFQNTPREMIAVAAAAAAAAVNKDTLSVCLPADGRGLDGCPWRAGMDGV